MTFIKFCGWFMYLLRAMDCAPCAMNLPLSTPKNESNSTRIWDFVEKMWCFPDPEAAILLLELAHPPGSRSKGRIADSGWRKSQIFRTKSKILAKFDPFFKVESGEFMAHGAQSMARIGTWNDHKIWKTSCFHVPKINIRFHPGNKHLFAKWKSNLADSRSGARKTAFLW